MRLPARVIVLFASALGGWGAACGGAESTLPPGEHCPDIYYGGGDIAQPPDGASQCPAGNCNYQTQEGCGRGEKCTVVIDNDARTVTPACLLDGTNGQGEACKVQADCARGFLCSPDPFTPGTSRCRKLCCGYDWSACDPGESCFHAIDASAGPTDDAKEIVHVHAQLCYPVGTCDVLDGKACDPWDRTCRIVDERGSVACGPKSNLVAGDECSEEQQCGPKLHCVENHCRELCRWGCCEKNTCSSRSDVCVHFTRDPVGVGECTPGEDRKPLPDYVCNGDGGLPNLSDAGLRD